MSELQSFFAPDDQSKTSTDLPGRVAHAAQHGELDTVQRWLAAGGSPDAALVRDGRTIQLLEYACSSSRPANAEVVRLLCAAGVNLEGSPSAGRPMELASKHGAEAAVRHLLRAGASVASALGGRGLTPLHNAVMTNNWRLYAEPWSIAQAKQAWSIGHEGVIRMLIAHGAEVDARISEIQITPLHLAAMMSGFISLDVIKELLKHGASLDAVDENGRNAEGLARIILSKPIYTGDDIPENPHAKRRPGAVEAVLDLLTSVRAAGSWKRYANAPRLDVVVLQALCAKGRATPPAVLARLFPTSTRSQLVPREIFWRILQFWRTDRDTWMPPPTPTAAELAGLFPFLGDTVEIVLQKGETLEVDGVGDRCIVAALRGPFPDKNNRRSTLPAYHVYAELRSLVRLAGDQEHAYQRVPETDQRPKHVHAKYKLSLHARGTVWRRVAEDA